MRFVCRRWLVATTLSLLATLASAANPAFMVDIEAQDLDKALQELALASRHKLFYETDLVRGQQSPALKGTYTTEEALRLLLADTGLEFEITAADVVLIRPRVGPVPAGATPAVEPATQTPPPAGRGTITGHVTDSSSGLDLQGALVRILETDQTTASDNLGAFRFSGLGEGEYTLSISYLGYTDKLWRVGADSSGQAQVDFPLEPSAWGITEVTVLGTRSSRALALNQQRTADNNSEVVSSDLLGNFTGTTISEALRRVAGVTFQRDPATGAGTNIMIRGLEPDMNAVKLNGLNLPVGNGTSRSANLNNILADSVSKITIHKTLLASHDSSGTGGLVEIETKSPLERPERYANLAVEGGRRGKDFGDDFLVSGTVSRTFGTEKNLGFSASAQYTEDDHNNSGFNTYLKFGEYLPLSPLGTPTFQLYDFDPRRTFPFEPGAGDVFADGLNIDFTHAHSATLALTLSGEWQPTPITSLKLDVQRSRNRGSIFSATGSANMQSDYVAREVQALGGEVRQAITYGGSAALSQNYSLTEGQTSVTDTYSFRMSSSPGRWLLNSTFGFAHGADRSPESDYLSVGFQADPRIFDSALGPDAFLPEAVDATEGIIITPFPRVSGKGIVLPLFTPATWDFFNDADNYNFGGAGTSSSRGRNDRYSADLNASYHLGWRAIETLETGFNFEKSRFSNTFSSVNASAATTVVQIPEPPYELYIPPSLAPLGLEFEPTDLSRVGHSGDGFHYLDEGGVRDFFGNFDEYSRNTAVISSVDRYLPTDLERQQLTDERSMAGYVQGKLDFGKLDIVAGVRLSRVNVRAVTVSSPSLIDFNGIADLAFARRFARLLDESVTQTDLLPRIALNFRQSDNLVFRGGYFLTTARPAISQLSSTEYVAYYQNPLYSPNFTQPFLNILRGNPGLKPAITHNFDIDAEYYDQAIGVIRLGAFYKRIEHSLQSNDNHELRDLSGIDLPDDPRFDAITPENTYIRVSRPENSNSPATIWGVELHVERQFSFLPGGWSGLGMYANISHTDSNATQILVWQQPDDLDAQGNILSYRERVFEITGQRFNLQSANSGTVALTYDKRGIDATLAYSFQDRYQNGYADYGLNEFSEGVKTLDLRAAYYFERFGITWRTFLEGTDLLKGPRDPDLLTSYGGIGGVEKIYGRGNYLGGREFRLGISATF